MRFARTPVHRADASAHLDGTARPSLSRTLLILLIALCCLGRAPAGLAQHYSFAQLGQGDGLSNLDVSAIVQDTAGVVWVGTENGVFRADSSHFVKVPAYRDADQGSVLAMHADASGRVWVAGSKLLVYITPDLALHTVARIELGTVFGDTVELSSLPADPDSLFLLTNGGLKQFHTENGGLSWDARAAFDPEMMRRMPVLSSLTSLAADPARNALWAGCGTSLCQLSLPRAGSAPARPEVLLWNEARGIPRGKWTHLLAAKNGSIWASGAGELVRLDPRTWAVDVLNLSAAGSYESQLAEDGEGSILATLPEGLARWKDGQWSRWTAANGLPSSEIVALFFDKHGGFWLAPIGGGIWRWLGYGSWQHWTRSEGLLGNVAWAMARDRQGRMWVAGADDLYSLDETAARLSASRPAARVQSPDSLAVDERGRVWAGSTQGTLTEIDPVTRRARAVDTSATKIYRLLYDPDRRRVWVCTSRGVRYLSPEDNFRELHPAVGPGAPTSNVWNVVQDRDGTLWFKTRSGLYRFENDVWTRIALPPEAAVLEFPAMGAAPDGSLWMQAPSPHPLLHLRVAGSEAHIVGSVPDELIHTDDIAVVYFDRRGWLWVGSDNGLYVFDGARWVHCTEEDGLVSDDLATAAVAEDPDGSMWFGTVGGLSHLLHPERLFQVSPPQLNVREVRIDGQRLRPGSTPRLNLREPELSVELFSSDYNRPRAVVFRYRLRGLNDAWQTSASGSLRFSSLPPADYVLTIQAVDTRVHAASAPVDYSFEVLPPWYRRDRAKLFALLLAVLVGALWWKASLSRLQRSEITLKRKVDQQTAELREEKEQLQRAQRELVESSRRDALTGLLNRSAIFEVLSRMRRRSLESGTPLCVIMADLDHFKSINDRFGHTMGDAVLRECAQRFEETLRPDDFVGRYGGEEILIVLPGLQRPIAAGRIEEIREAIACRPVVHGAHKVQVTSSFGVAWLSEHNREIESVVNDADAALYMAKQNGRNRVEFAPELDDPAYTRSHPFETSAPEITLLPAAVVETK